MKYLTELCEGYDMVMVQEHWLYQFELDEITSFFPNHRWAARAVDEKDPILPTHKPRGKAGVLTIWKEGIDNMVQTEIDGSPRTLVVTIKCQEKDVCLINTYMPTYTGSCDEYAKMLDEIYEIGQKYADHIVVWGGDLNASLRRVKKNKHDALLTKFCKDELWVDKTGCSTSTYFNNNGSQSQIDYFLIQKDHANKLSGYHIMPPCSQNLSTHVAVVCELDVQEKMIKSDKDIPKTEKLIAKPKPKWKKIDTDMYVKNVEEAIEAMNDTNANSLPPEVQIACLHDILDAAATDAAPPRRKAKSQRKKKYKWSATIQAAAKKSKNAFYLWKKYGQKEKGNKWHHNMLKCKKDLRRTQRKEHAEEKYDRYEKIMMYAGNNHNDFYKLVKEQRNKRSANTEILIHDNIEYRGDQVLDAWADYFERLASMKNKANYCQESKTMNELKCLLLERIEQDKESDPDSLPTCDEILKGISSLKSNKAADGDGMTAEHFKFVKETVAPILQDIFKAIILRKDPPASFQHGIVTPVLKKNKVKSNPDHYRRITVTQIISKLMEFTIAPNLNACIESKQNPLQRGFTSGCSSANAAFFLTEAVAEATDLKKTLYVAMLDASKAFDVVVHSSLLAKLYNLDFTGVNWLLLQKWYQGMGSQVKWSGMLSRLIKEYIGLRQGGKLSAKMYVGLTNNNLDELKDNSIGFKIGTEYVGCPTCADDTAIVSDCLYQLQVALYVCESFARKEHFDYSLTKTRILVYNRPKVNQDNAILTWDLEGKEIQHSVEQEHLGIIRNTSSYQDKLAEDRIKKGRRTLYSLMGTGVHGLNGLNPRTSSKMWKIYVLPQMLFGLEVTNNPTSEIKKIEQFQRETMKQLQGLPPNASNAATYLLLGIVPLEGALEKSILTTFCTMLRNTNTAEYRILYRQLATKNVKSKSWINIAKDALYKYGLPSAYDLVLDTPEKDSWKHSIKNAINLYHENELKEQIANQKSCRYINVESCSMTKGHHVWNSASSNPREVTRAAMKAKILTGNYNLQAKRSYFKNESSTANCHLCNSDPENREHFVVTCPTSNHVRDGYMPDIYQVLTSALGVWEARKIWETPHGKLQVVLDSSFYIKGLEQIYEIERLSRNLLFALHLHRTAILSISTHTPDEQPSQTTFGPQLPPDYTPQRPPPQSNCAPFT